MKTLSYTLIVLFLGLSGNCFAQVSLKSDYYFTSPLTNKEDGKFGKGDFFKISGRYTLPFSVKQNSSGQLSIWAATLSGSYGMSDYKNLTIDIIPDRIINFNLSVSHMRSLSQKWFMIASLGGGIYSQPDAISAKSILVNGNIIYIYRLLDNLDVGIGVGVSTSYGVPMVMPMSYIKYKITGKYELNFEAANSMQISASAKFGDRFKLKLVAMEMDGMSAVMNIEGKSKIYSSAIMRSYLNPEYRIGKSSILYVGAGVALLRSAKISDRTLKYFWETFDDKDDANSYRFKPTWYFNIGFKYGF